MKRLIFLLTMMLGVTAYGQNYEEASVALFEKGQPMMFVLQDEDHYVGMYFFPRENKNESVVEVEMRDYQKSSKMEDMLFRPEVDGVKIKLYIPSNGVYFGHVLFHYDKVFVYDANGDFLFKLPRYS